MTKSRNRNSLVPCRRQGHRSARQSASAPMTMTIPVRDVPKRRLSGLICRRGQPLVIRNEEAYHHRPRSQGERITRSRKSAEPQSRSTEESPLDSGSRPQQALARQYLRQPSRFLSRYAIHLSQVRKPRNLEGKRPKVVL